MSALNRILLVSIFNTAQILAVCPLFLIGVGDNEYIAVHVARAFCTPLDFQLDSICGGVEYAVDVHCFARRAGHGVQTYHRHRTFADSCARFYFLLHIKAAYLLPHVYENICVTNFSRSLFSARSIYMACGPR